MIGRGEDCDHFPAGMAGKCDAKDSIDLLSSLQCLAVLHSHIVSCGCHQRCMMFRVPRHARAFPNGPHLCWPLLTLFLTTALLVQLSSSLRRSFRVALLNCCMRNSRVPLGSKSPSTLGAPIDTCPCGGCCCCCCNTERIFFRQTSDDRCESLRHNSANLIASEGLSFRSLARDPARLRQTDICGATSDWILNQSSHGHTWEASEELGKAPLLTLFSRLRATSFTWVSLGRGLPRH